MRIYSFRDCVGDVTIEVVESHHANARSLVEAHLLKRGRADLVPRLEYVGSSPISSRDSIPGLQRLVG